MKLEPREGSVNHSALHGIAARVMPPIYGYWLAMVELTVAGGYIAPVIKSVTEALRPT